MPRRSLRKQARRHIWFYEEDWHFIDMFIAPRAHLSPGSWCREVIHKVVSQLREEQHMHVEKAHRGTHPAPLAEPEVAE